MGSFLAWYHMEIARMVKKRRMTCHANWNIKRMILISWISANTNPANLLGRSVPTVLWSVEHCKSAMIKKEESYSSSKTKKQNYFELWNKQKHALLRILLEGVESKKEMGARKTDVIIPKKTLAIKTALPNMNIEPHQTSKQILQSTVVLVTLPSTVVAHLSNNCCQFVALES